MSLLYTRDIVHFSFETVPLPLILTLLYPVCSQTGELFRGPDRSPLVALKCSVFVSAQKVRMRKSHLVNLIIRQ